MIELKSCIDYPAEGQCCVYFLFIGSEIIYIGQTINLKARARNHEVEFETLKYIPCNADDMNNLEALKIIEYKPKLNFTIPPNDNFKSMMHLKKAVFNELLKVRSPYNKKTNPKQPKNQTNIFYVTNEDYKNLSRRIRELIADEFS